MAWVMRLIYEFWGFCVHGTDDLRRPGGISTSHTTGSYLTFATGFESGSTVLLASGSDAQTYAGTDIITVDNPIISASYKAKWITLWKSGSTSTDDSIYPITQWINSSSFRIDPTYGGTSMGPTGSVPQMTSRTNVNWRIVDYAAAANLAGYADNQHMVLQFDAASTINPGQAKSQFQLRMNNGGYSTLSNPVIRLSPSGSWDGNQFTGPEASYADVQVEQGRGPGTGGWSGWDWFRISGFNRNTGYVTIIAEKGFLIVQIGGDWIISDGSYMHIEIPYRIYPQDRDPNLITAFNIGCWSVQLDANIGFGYSMRWFPSPHDSTLRRWATVIPGYVGAWWSTVYTGVFCPQYWDKRYTVTYNQFTNEHLILPAYLTFGTFFSDQSISGKFSMARARLRSVRYIPNVLAKRSRVDSGDAKWINVNGVLFPWDNAQVPGRPLFAGW